MEIDYDLPRDSSFGFSFASPQKDFRLSISLSLSLAPFLLFFQLFIERIFFLPFRVFFQSPKCIALLLAIIQFLERPGRGGGDTRHLNDSLLTEEKFYIKGTALSKIKIYNF